MKAYWFSNNGVSQQGTRHNVGQTYTVDGQIEPCVNGLHGSEHPSDALAYACGATLDLVELSGTVIPNGNPPDKYAASVRKHVARIDATQLLREHARWCALQVIDKWNAPDVVQRYLETEEKFLRAAAWAAARVAARDAARNAARDAAWAAAWAATRAAAWAAARDAARDAARAAAWAAARDVARAAVWAAAWAAACAAARDAQRCDFISRVNAAFATEIAQ